MNQPSVAPSRSDAGLVRLTGRDITGLVLAGDMYAAPYDLLAAALAVRPDRMSGQSGIRNASALVGIWFTGRLVRPAVRRRPDEHPWRGLVNVPAGSLLGPVVPSAQRLAQALAITELAVGPGPRSSSPVTPGST